VRETDVTLPAAPLPKAVTLIAEFDEYSPIDPACALSFVVVPLIPTVLDGVIRQVAVIAEALTVPVKVGEASVAYGESNEVNPAPLTVLFAESVVNAPVLGAVLPIDVGLASFATTYPVVAIWVLFVNSAAVGAAGVPVNVGLATGAYVEAALAVVR
jgi:hypothetical protein